MQIKANSPYVATPGRPNSEFTGGPNEPWISKEAIARLDELLTPDMVGIEWGSGAGTIWYASRLKFLHTYEHEKVWVDKLQLYVDRYAVDPNVTIHHAPATQEGDSQFLGNDGRYYEQYSMALGSPDKADVIFVDGRARSACLKTAIQKLSSGGVLVLDDARRDRYDVSVVPSEWLCEEHYNAAYSTKIWLAQSK
ncbi:MAG: hypothetical protein CME17_01010 [Gemmatimonadetes bacterium]|nr:hypothetical protein [Gemmatimonadota bacterium]|tara:strand:- start:4558 stop:5142 length:585 start_codon:yes stop_codon:yes gene_type:complete